jgi:GT2 family glycosyltransferase
MAIDAAVVVLNWNRYSDTKECIKSLNLLENVEFQIIVVDNASSDNSVALLKDEFPSVHYIENDSNYGFAKGNNIGIRFAMMLDTKYIWLLNNDTEVTSNSLCDMVKQLDKNLLLGAVGSIFYYFNDRKIIQAWGGGRINLFTGRNRHVLVKSQINYLMGASILVRVEILRASGLLNENFFMYWEDTDLSLRIQKAGYLIDVCQTSIVYHKVAASSPNKPHLEYLLTKSSVLFFKLHAQNPYFALSLSTFGRIIKHILNGNFASMYKTFLGFKDGIIQYVIK